MKHRDRTQYHNFWRLRWMALWLTLCLLPALTACGTTGNTTGNGDNAAAAMALQDTIPSAERMISEGVIHLGNDRVPAFVTVVGERELLQMDTYSSYPLGSVEATIKYATQTKDQAQADKEAAQYIQALETEGFVCDNPAGETITGDYTVYRLHKDSTDAGMIINVSIYYDAESHLVSVSKGPAQ